MRIYLGCRKLLPQFLGVKFQTEFETELQTEFLAQLNFKGLTIAPSKTKFLIFGIKRQIRGPLSINIEGGVPKEKSLVHLNLHYGKTLRDIKHLIIHSLKEKIRTTHGAFARVKNQFDRRTLGHLYNAFFVPNIFF